jgi:hypothetical protein
LAAISELTRRDLRDFLETTWSGRLGDVEFLSRLYDLRSLPSTDRRLSNMAEDIHKHTPPANNDWPQGWVFYDVRLGLDDDRKLLRLVAETLHPAVIAPDVDVEAQVRALNEILTPDGFELFPEGSMSGRTVFGVRPTTPRRTPTGPFSSSLVSGIAKVFADAYSHTEIDSLFEDQDFPRPRDFGANKVEKVKAWLRAGAEERTFDHWRGLAKVLATVLEPDAPEGSPAQSWQKRIKELMAGAAVAYLPGGMLTTGATKPSVASIAGGVPDLMPPPKDWQRLGQGGFGTVYAVRDEQLQVDFAIKVFDPSPFANAADANARFLREAGLLFRLNHKYVVRVFHAGTLADGRPFIRMERFDGETLQSFLDRRPVTVDEGVAIVGRLAAALEHAHGQAIYHRDLKPSNVLVSTSLDDLRLIDFGLGILVEEAVSRSRLTTSEHHFGGAYSAPELLENAKTVGPHLDVYSLGAVWFRLAFGRAPQGAGLDELINGSELPQDLRALLRRCISASPTLRPSMTEVLTQLRAWVKSHSAPRRGEGTVPV